MYYFFLPSELLYIFLIVKSIPYFHETKVISVTIKNCKIKLGYPLLQIDCTIFKIKFSVFARRKKNLLVYHCF